ncbi:MAG: CRTAC1 family protein [Chloroflexaceae bacterium]|nr:CRTAC1 family protein [Chloroflexaceae bacterium]
MVGNDFNRRDMIWLSTPRGWQADEPFHQTTENTMGMVVADINNDAMFELFATDMKPYDQSTETMAKWLPVMSKLTRPLSADDPQYPENSLQQYENGAWRDKAYDLQIDSSGWSWSGKFGDLDNDGWQDLYVVNGMIAKDLFAHLPEKELIESNMLFHNRYGETFEPVDWGLNDPQSGRGMSMADFNNDGRLDVVINPLNASAMVYENTFCRGQSIRIKLIDTSVANQAAIGATIRVHVGNQIYTRTVTAISGYLSGDDTVVHVGIGDASRIDNIVVIWPDGNASEIDAQPVNATITITRGGEDG